jgi:hypothetical protein
VDQLSKIIPLLFFLGCKMPINGDMARLYQRKMKEDIYLVNIRSRLHTQPVGRRRRHRYPLSQVSTTDKWHQTEGSVISFVLLTQTMTICSLLPLDQQ